MAELSISRRRLLQATGWTAVGVTVLYFGGRSVLSILPSFDIPDEDAGAAWLQIGSDGRCRMLCPRAEMGQNASIGLAQIAAEELNLAVEEIDVRFPTTSEIPQVVLTAGSMSLRLFSEPTARAAAALREIMRGRAAERSGADLATVEDAVEGFALPGGRRLSYADLAGGEPVVLDAGDVPEARLYSFDPDRPHRQIGRCAAPHQLEQIVTGAPLFAGDVRVADMLFGRTVRPAARSAALAHVDDTRARDVPGLVRVVVEGGSGFVGVVCETPGSADAAIEALDVRWELPAPFDQRSIDELVDIDAALIGGDLEHTPRDDRFDPEPAWDVDLRFEVQIQSHAMQEPRAAVAHVTRTNGGESAEIWTGSQDAFVVQRQAARDLGISKDRVIVHARRMGGGFGGREHYDVERDAARLSRVVGRPVKVQWSREDEFRAARNRPSSTHRIKLKADEQGRLMDWWHAFVSGHIIFARERLPAWMLTPARLIGDLGVARGSAPPYAAQRMRVEYADTDLPIDLGTWRSLGAAPNTFVIESAIDELARLYDQDPVEFRLRNLDPEHDRLSACLRKTRELAEKVALPIEAGIGRGYACGIYEEHSFVAASADVRVDPVTGAIRVTRMCCAQDVGLAVNPDQLAAQIEGNLIWGLGMALLERVEIGQSEITSLNFDRYALPRIQDAPDFDIEIISPRSVRPAGAGETAIIVAPPAIANAVRQATGRRHTALPIRRASPAV
ncbi:MAG: xanthine dehydrogenase family protein molybdopterin-binding subunit [Deltaproteobacteria bacterium]|nr:xanthine dehydrogenase family protein molybdopterin-binding subunit [Deltaproteobacteria bacterium]